MNISFSELKNIVKNFNARISNPLKGELDSAVNRFKTAYNRSIEIDHKDPIKRRDSMLARRPKSDPGKEHEGWNKLTVENWKRGNPLIYGRGVSLHNELDLPNDLIGVDFAWKDDIDSFRRVTYASGMPVEPIHKKYMELRHDIERKHQSAIDKINKKVTIGKEWTPNLSLTNRNLSNVTGKLNKIEIDDPDKDVKLAKQNRDRQNKIDELNDILLFKGFKYDEKDGNIKRHYEQDKKTGKSIVQGPKSKIIYINKKDKQKNKKNNKNNKGNP